ncbi:hypothetical protein [Geitlerinema sp. PCC 9228]|jgi:hypothetical protein|uniref:hypothetical protein n=1 Tax=Geitlerinema sp. PCC 9228 TaxID=111611 RepID=UPI0008F99433|nr:hypothetical protein [Geitlerinema sp. PCC 9228]
MPATEIEWSQTEKEIAQAAFVKAREREVNATIETVRQAANAIANADELWRLHDFLSSKRHEIDGKYDYRYPVLLLVFSQLVKEGWLCLDELQGLAPDKITKVSALSRM